MKQFNFSIQKGIALLLLVSAQAYAHVTVLTYHNDNTRIGLNANETTLTPANVNPGSFGKLFSYTVDGFVYAQPLYVSGLNIAGGTHNVVFVCTEHDSVYAFDADSNADPNGGLLWQVSLGTSAPTPSAELPFEAIEPEVGITGTPVIDAGSQTLYVDAFTEENGTFFHRVHALNLADGSEKPGSPVVVAVSVPGIGNGSTNGVMTFQPIQQLQRSALTLAGGVLYVCFAGFTDTPQTDPYHGWIIGFDPGSLQIIPNQVFCTTPNGTVGQFGSIAGRGAIWMGGGDMAVDGNNNLFFATGDGNFNAFDGGTDYGDTYLKLSTGGGLAVADYFTPSTADFQQVNDLDTGSGGVILLPDQPGPFPHLMVGAGKLQRAFVINRDMMTSDGQHFNSTGSVDQVVQSMPLGGGSFSTPAYFNEKIYYVASKDSIRSYSISNGILIPDLPNSAGTRKFAFPGASPFVSANGDSDGIVWAIQNAQPAVLVAWDANDLSTELYNSSLASGDQLTGGVKFVAPIVANGKVYAGSQNALTVFGLINSGGGGGGWTPINADYSGLFFEGGGIEFGRSGDVSIKTTKKASYSGKLELAGKSYSFHGTFDANGVGSTTISAKNLGVLTLNLQVNTTDNTSISGSVDGDSWSADLIANQSLFSKKTNPAPFAGKYNITFPGPNDGNPDNPQNDGTGTVTVSTTGQVKFKGVLGDGTKVSQSATVSQTGDWPFYIPLYKSGGQIMGWLNFDGAGDVGGGTSWIKLPNAKNKAFPDGFELTPVATGSEE